MKMSMMSISLFVFLLLVFSRSSVFSELPPTQKSTMINLFQLLLYQSNYYVYDHKLIRWNASTNPCTWKGVICSSDTNSVTQLDFQFYLSTYHMLLSNSSFLSIACQIETLEVLDVSGNFLKSIPDDFFTSCGKLLRLKSLDFSDNDISGNLPSFGHGRFTKLESLDLSRNSLDGSIGVQLDGLVGLKSLKLGSNYFTGSLPASLGKLKGLESLDLSYNLLNESIIGARFNGLGGLKRLYLNFNNFRSIPVNLENLKGLKELYLSGNILQGRIPEQLVYGKNLTVLDLSGNRLVKTIPSELLLQPKLKTLDLSNNNLVGAIPGNVSASLVRLSLGGNLLIGSIPPSISDWTKLKHLDLQNNNLSGSIPINIVDMISLVELRLENNHISGEIPPMPRKTQFLDLSNNIISGKITPEILLDFSIIKYLNLSRNRLYGAIPSQLGQSSYVLDLSYNSLSGRIPSGLQKFKYEAFVGNLDLCGPVMEISCRIVEEGDVPSKQEENESQKDDIYLGLYVSIGLGFYLAFSGVCGALTLKHSWRYAYFNFVDTNFNRIYVSIAIYVARFQRNSQT